ncbi:MAG: 7-cyano-7-deazaguanine synthase [Thaumarchaeota archaeon]|nr:7-cyano-7-deazaguanine synthase [Nitrososphaerota archaeon]
MATPEAVVLLSGGIDSATCLRLSARDYKVRAPTFAYHGIAASELRAARAVGEAEELAEHRFVQLPDLRESGDIPGATFGSLPKTYIPLRNAVFYSLAAAFAEEVRADVIVGGHNRDDLQVFPDTSRSFFNAMQRALRKGSPVLERRRIRLLRPLQYRSKERVISLAASLDVPFGLTWSCHREGDRHCWNCDGCRARIEAFKAAGIRDPLFAGRHHRPFRYPSA